MITGIDSCHEKTACIHKIKESPPNGILRGHFSTTAWDMLWGRKKHCMSLSHITCCTYFKHIMLCIKSTITSESNLLTKSSVIFLASFPFKERIIWKQQLSSLWVGYYWSNFEVWIWYFQFPTSLAGKQLRHCYYQHIDFMSSNSLKILWRWEANSAAHQ